MKSKSIIIILLVACVLASCAPTNKVTPTETISTATLIPTLPVTPTTIPIDPIAGNWTGTFQGISDNFSADIDVFIDNNCEINKSCGTYSAPSLPCSGNLILTQINNATFVFVEQKIDGADWCGSGGFEYMELLPDNTLSWGYSDPGKSIKSKGTLIKLESAIGKTWEEERALLTDSPFTYQSGQFWNQEEIPGSAVAFSTGVRWNFDIEVENTGKDATGIFFQGYLSNGNEQTLGLYYSSGSWHLGYASNGTYGYWWDFDDLTSPQQSFVLSVSHDGTSISIKNNEGFNRDIRYRERIFDGADVIVVGFLSSPHTKISLSKVVIEQLTDPAIPIAATTSLEKPYSTSFENLDVTNSIETSPFRSPNTLDWVSFYTRDIRTNSISKDVKFASWTVDSRAHTGKYAINVIPNGNPVTKYMLPVTIAVLDPIFDVSGYDTVNLKIWINTTSNPRVASVHNCDSQLKVYYKTDSGAPWADYGTLCGENIKETQGWHEISLDFDVKGKSTIQFAFTYEVQNVANPDPGIYYLIDDIEITAK